MRGVFNLKIEAEIQLPKAAVVNSIVAEMLGEAVARYVELLVVRFHVGTCLPIPCVDSVEGVEDVPQ